MLHVPHLPPDTIAAGPAGTSFAPQRPQPIRLPRFRHAEKEARP